MALIDHMEIRVQAGKGGDGVVRWLHLKGKEKAGPAGGDGGHGGAVILRGVRDIEALARYRYTKEFVAENGAPGDNNNKHGRNGKDIVIEVPVGSVITNSITKETDEILTEGQELVVAKGGAGGYGNAHFKSSVEQNPMLSSKGKKGQVGDIEITLKLIADAGFIGYPNAGKSSLINELTRARSKVGAYPFTTLEPSLGSWAGYVLADVPGLIEGAAEGKGLGHKFLKHIERTKLLVHLVSAEQDSLKSAYLGIRDELTTYSQDLAEKPEIVLLTKIDLIDNPSDIEAKVVELKEVAKGDVYPISILDPKSFDAFTAELSRRLGAL